nr:carboxypeptidase M32 [Aquisphaera giovannonii]
MVEIQDSYEELLRRTREMGVLSSCAGVLSWDEQTCMPTAGAEHRGEQMALLAGLMHERAINPRIGELLRILEDGSSLFEPDSVEAANIKESLRNYDRATRLPRKLVEDLARTTSLAQHEWAAARQESSYGRFRPWLEKIVALKREEGQALQDLLHKGQSVDSPPAGVSHSIPESEDPSLRSRTPEGDPIYDALLDEYEPGARSGELSALFLSLRDQLIPLVRAIGEASARLRREKEWPRSILKRRYPADRQRFFAEMVAASIGFDFHRGRLDVTAHPFCTGLGPGDTRITTRYDESQFGEAFFGVLHEAGHGLYEQGLPALDFGTPMGEAVSLGIHESQSRLWENAVARSGPFWDYWFPLARGVFREALHDVSLGEFLAAINRVEPSLIRTDADEVTYNLHVIIRFELERALLRGDLGAADLPSAWGQRYTEMLGITPSNDAEGCLQDIHWSAGLFGYFPTYTLGNLYAAQLYSRASLDLADLDGAFTRGDFSGLLGWLRERIHRHGRRYRPSQLIERATGRPPEEGPLIASLRRKYEELYSL